MVKVFLLCAACLVSGFASSGLALYCTRILLDNLPVGPRYFADTPIKGLTYGEFFASLAIAFSFAFLIGLVHGRLYGKGYAAVVIFAAVIPPLVMMLAIAAATLGMGLIAFPLVVAYGLIVAHGLGKGAKLRPQND